MPGIRGRWRVACATTILGTLAVWAGAGPPSANAGQLTAKRALATQVEARITAAQMRLEGVIQRYDGAVAHLGTVRHAMRANHRELLVARANLAAARIQLARIITSQYKAGQQPSGAILLLGAHSFTDLINQITMTNQIGAQETTVLNQIRRSEIEIETRQAALRKEAVVARRLVTRAAKTRRSVVAMISAQRRMLAGIQSDIRAIISRQQAAQAAAARAAAAAAATARPPPAPTGAAPAPTGGTPPPGGANGIGEQAAQLALSYLGVPYVWGGASPSGFDCSGLTMYVYGQLGIHLLHFTGDQWNEGTHVPVSQIQPGDLVFFDNLGHEGMYIGNGTFIHAPHTGTVVQLATLSGYWMQHLDGVVRVA